MGERYALKGDWREIWIKRGPLEAGRFWSPSGPHTQMWGTSNFEGLFGVSLREVFLYFTLVSISSFDLLTEKMGFPC